MNMIDGKGIHEMERANGGIDARIDVWEHGCGPSCRLSMSSVCVLRVYVG